MEIRKIEVEDLKNIYPYIEQDFNDNERKSLAVTEKHFKSHNMIGYCLYEENELIAYAMFVCLDDLCLLDYLAVIKKYRNQHIGSQFLKLLQKEMKQYKTILAEVENPDYCIDIKEKEVMNHRIHFYLENGFVDTGTSATIYFVEYRFLELSHNKNHSTKQTYEMMEKFYSFYWPDAIQYKKYVKMHDEMIEKSQNTI